MKVLVWGSGIFLGAFLIHLAIWKIHIPKRGMKYLLLIFLFTLILGITLLHLSKYSSRNYWEYIHICALVISLFLAYVVTYSAIEVDSPSLVMVMTIAQAGSYGMNEAEFEKKMGNDVLVIPRVRDLIVDKMAFIERGKYKLTSKGILLAKIFIFYRKLMNAPKGG